MSGVLLVLSLVLAWVLALAWRRGGWNGFEADAGSIAVVVVVVLVLV